MIADKNNLTYRLDLTRPLTHQEGDRNTQTIEDLIGDVSTLDAESFKLAGLYEQGTIISSVLDVVDRSGVLYRIKNSNDLPYTITGDWNIDRDYLQGISETTVTKDPIFVQLTSGQTEVIFTDNVTGNYIHISGESVDSKFLIHNIDYTIDSVNKSKIYLSESYPAGTYCVMIFK